MSEEFLGTDQSQIASTAQPESTAPVTAESKAEYTEFLQAITNQDGKPKYKTVADALLGAARAQEHIARIEAENAELRVVSKKVETMEQLLARLGEGKQTDQSARPGIEDQEQLVLSVLEKRESAAREQANRQSVLNALQSKFGDKTTEMLNSKAAELGLSTAELGALAARSPKAVLSYFGAEGKGTPTVQGTVNTEALTPKQGQATAPENIMWGASTKDVVGFFRQIKQEVNKELGIS